MTHLDYCSANIVDPRAIRLNRIFFRVALACGILPMTAGITILVLYYFGENEEMIVAGFYAILLGGGVVLTGLGFAITWCVRQRKIDERLGVSANLDAGVRVVGLLLANFVVAFICACVGDSLYSSSHIFLSIANETDADITNVTAQVGKARQSLGTFKSGEFDVTGFSPRRNKDVRIHVEQNGFSKELTTSFSASPIPNSTSLRIRVRPGFDLVPEFLPPFDHGHPYSNNEMKMELRP